MSIAPPVAPVLGRIQAITARFETIGSSAARATRTAGGAGVAAAGVRASGFDAVLGDALGAGASAPSGPADLLAAMTGRSSVSPMSAGLGGAAIDLRRLGVDTPPGPDGNDVIAAATRYVGVPYQWGGTDPGTGLDCSGLVQRAYRDVGVELPRVSYDQARAGRPVASLAEARPGDLIAFGEPVDHIALYVGDGKILQAPRRGEVVSVTAISRPIAAIRRVLADGPAGVASPPPSGAPSGAGVAPTAPTGARAVPGAERFAELFEAAGARHGVDPRLLAAVARVESNFNPAALSPAGAVGLMQFMPATARGLGIDPRDPAQAVDGAARYLASHLRQFGSVDLALAAYNAGPGAVRRFGGVPPYAETRSYVAKVNALLGTRP